MNWKHKDLILQAYAAFNRLDANALLALVGDDVDWPEDDVRLHGKDAVRAYWLKEWAKIHPHDEPVAISDLWEERSAVRIDQVVYALDGSVRQGKLVVEEFFGKSSSTPHPDVCVRRRGDRSSLFITSSLIRG